MISYSAIEPRHTEWNDHKTLLICIDKLADYLYNYETGDPPGTWAPIERDFYHAKAWSLCHWIRENQELPNDHKKTSPAGNHTKRTSAYTFTNAYNPQCTCKYCAEELEKSRKWEDMKRKEEAEKQAWDDSYRPVGKWSPL